MKRTDIDFSKHEIIVIENEVGLIHKIKLPNTWMNGIIFMNSCGAMSVTGDFGNWIFCREFHPSAEGEVSDGYWCEKLQISSTQVHSKYDAGRTQKAIEALLKDEDDLSEKETEYLKECLDLVDDELDYTYYAYRSAVGRFEDLECVPFVKSQNFWLDCIFDGFEEICQRLKKRKSHP